MLLCAVAAASAKGVSADLRVVGAGGKTLAEETLQTGTTKVPTSPKATCLGKGTGGSGKSVTVRGATALGLLAQGAKSTASSANSASASAGSAVPTAPRRSPGT